VRCVSLDKGEEATENQTRSEVLHSLHFPSGTGQIDPISFIIKTPSEPLEICIRKNIFSMEKRCRIPVRRE